MSKKTVAIEVEERYPEYVVHREGDYWFRYGLQVEIDDFLLWRYRQAIREFNAVQSILQEIYEEKST